MSGPLRGVKVVELAGLAPVPLCGMILGDFGASVIKVDRAFNDTFDTLTRGKRSVAVDLKSRAGIEVVKKLAHQADVLLEPFRPGVMERLGLGPELLLEENPRLIYARLTGYGQHGPMSQRAGHDINYLATSGLLSMIGRKGEKPLPPLNLVADFGGGSLTCAFGILAALLERGRSGKGQVLDASMVEGAAYMGSWVFMSQNLDFAWGKDRGENLLDTGNPIYDVYETSDGLHVSVGALEPQFCAEIFQTLGMDFDMSDVISDPQRVRNALKEKFTQKTRNEWSRIFENLDACVTPVLSLEEAANASHSVERGSFLAGGESDVREPRPSPLLSRTPASPKPRGPPLRPGLHSREILLELGYTIEKIRELELDSVVESAEENPPASKL